MPRIRKKTSSRVSTNDRRKVKNKVRESRKKKKKVAKKIPQWKSKIPKDPGIPNNFPFKDQVLAEISEQRRIDAEEKQRKREEKNALLAQARGALDEEGREMEGETEKVSAFGTISGIGAKRPMNVQALGPARMAYVEDDKLGDQVSPLIHRNLPTLRTVLDESDVIVEVLDARDPLPFRSMHLEEFITSKPGKQILLVLTKIDTCPRESIIAWLTYLRTHHPTFLFRSATAFLPSESAMIVQSKGKGKAKIPADDALGVDLVLAYISECARAKNDGKPLTVAVLGLSNVGKSSFVNSVLQKPAFPIYSLERTSGGPSTTEVAQETMMDLGGKQIRWIDTPGLVWESDDSATSVEVRAHDILLRCRGRIDRLKDPSMAISHIVTRSCTEDLMLLYGLPAFAKGEPNAFLSGVARSHRLVKKQGELDLTSASRIVLRDWSSGNFPRCTIPLMKSTTSVTATSVTATSVTARHTDTIEELHAGELCVLATLRTRKEMWKSRGLVKLIPGNPETRVAVLDQQWCSLDGEKENLEACDSAVEGSLELNDDDGAPGGASDENDSDEVETADGLDEAKVPRDPLPIFSRVKRKREAEHTTSRSNKIMSSSPSEGRSSRHSRTTGSLKRMVYDKPTIQTRLVFEQERKVANVLTKTKQIQGVDDEAYDFSQFFHH